MISVLLVKGFNIGVRTIALFALAKISSPQEFGVISLMMAAAEILRIVADFGVDTLSVRDFAISPSREIKSKIASNVAAIKLVLGSIVYLIMILSIAISKYNVHFFLGALVGTLLLTSLWSNLSINYFQSQLNTKTLVLPSFLIALFTLFLLTVAILLKSNVVIAFAAIPFSEMIGTFVLYLYIRKEIGIKISNLSKDKILELLKRSFPIAITAISVVIYTRLDIFALGNFSSKSEMGFYGVAYRITEPFQFMASAFAISIYSNISSLLSYKKGNVFSKVKKYLALSGIYSLGASLFIVSIAPFFVQNFLPKYLPCIPILYSLSIALIFRVFNNCMTSVINAYGQYYRVTVVGIWNLFLMCFLILFFSYLNKINAVNVASILAFVEFVNSLIQVVLLYLVIKRRPAKFV